MTDSSGIFTLDEVPVGTQTVGLSKTGYAPYKATVAVVEKEVVNLGNVPMISSFSTGTIMGTVADSSGQPLSGVTITVAGAWSGNAVTGSDGSYTFTFVTPGQVTMTAAKSGYQTITATGTVFARTTLTFSPRLDVTPSQATTGAIVGRVVEAVSGLPIDHLPDEEGVTVRLSGGVVVEPDPDNGGYFNIQDLAPNTYQVTIGMRGFTSKTFRVVITAGTTTDLGTIRLNMTVSKMTLTGKVTDATTGDPIVGAEVAVMGTELASRTDFAGTYTITDIDHPSEFTLRTSATGYIDKSLIISSAPWTHTINIALKRQVTSGSLTGTVVDAASGQPLNGVELTLVSDPSVTSATNSSGIFNFNAIPGGAQQIKLALNGYAQRVLTTQITEGKTSDVGKIALSVNPTSASVQGTVWDAVENAPFAGVDIEVSGTGYWRVLSATDGTYRVTDVTPGEVSVAATGGPKPGYFGSRFTGKLEPGGILIFNPSLSTTPPPGVLKGIITDFGDNQAIQGATIRLTPTPPGVVIAFSDASGAFTITDIAPAKYTVTISAPGYWSQNVNLEIKSRYLGETTIEVQLQRQVSSTTVTGRVADSATGAPISNAVVSISGTGITATSEADGSYRLSGIKALEFTIRTTAQGYDTTNYRIKTNVYATYTIDLRLGASGTSTSRIYGTVRDAATGNPVEGAEVSIVGGGRSTLSGPDGKYSLEGVTVMGMDLKVSATGYDSRYHPLALDAFGEYEVSFTLTKSRPSTIIIKSLSTDKLQYAANEPVVILSEIENIGDAAVEMSVGTQISDQYGNVAGMESLPGGSVSVAPHATQSVSIPWNTGQAPPGPYQITLNVVDYTLGGLLAERSSSISITPTAMLDGLVSIISPKFINVGATETIAVSAYLVNKSNTDASFSARYEIKDPEGALLKDGSLDFSLTTTEAFITIPLTEFSNTFGKSGQYQVNVMVYSGENLIAQSSDAIFVAPSIRIEPAKSLDPATVIPDGDKEIRVNIRLKGVEVRP